jgi:hypothetical protein
VVETEVVVLGITEVVVVGVEVVVAEALFE